MTLHENKNYKVDKGLIENNSRQGYQVVNKTTEIVELETCHLPEAITQAEHSNVFLVNKLWTWIEQQSARSTSTKELEDVLEALTDGNDEDDTPTTVN